MGYDVIIIETVGAGQQEVDIAGCVHSTAVVNIPGMGDAVQAMKAGLLEIGDVLVVNKSDLPGAEALAHTLEIIVSLRGHREAEWRPPVVKTIAAERKGTTALVDALFEHRRYLRESGLISGRITRNAFSFFQSLVAEMVEKKLLGDSPELATLRDDLRRRAVDPYTAAATLIARLFPGGGSS
jgi:LAO/AO transport system kinase